MRQASRRFAALIPHPNRWETVVEWGNRGLAGILAAAPLISGTVTASALSQTRWTCDLTLTDVKPGMDGVNPYNTQLRVWHGIAGEPLLPMGAYKVTDVARTAEGLLSVRGASFESYLMSPFDRARSFVRQPASMLAGSLIREVVPSAQLAWMCPDFEMPRLTGQMDRWPLIDGNRDAKSVAKSVGSRIYTTGAGTWEARPVPALTDPVVWTADEGPEGVLLSAAEELTADGVYNIVIASGQSVDTGFRAGRAEDLDPLSATYVKRSVDLGGFGPQVERYTSALVTNSAQAQTVAQSRLASVLGLRQKVTFAQTHDPRLEPGDVGLVRCVDGYRRVLLDSVQYDLLGGPLQAQTRTTATNLAGMVTEVQEAA